MPTRLPTSLADMAGDWVGAAELEKLFGVGRQRVQQIVSQPSFPKPTIVLKMGKVWRTDDVRRWAQARGRDLYE